MCFMVRYFDEIVHLDYGIRNLRTWEIITGNVKHLKSETFTYVREIGSFQGAGY